MRGQGLLKISICIRYSTAPRPSLEYECGKRNPLYPIRATSFVSIIMYLTCTIIVLLKKMV
jgi:hypothetical protein